jgi:three-Cys-motif partner protein
MKNETLFGEDDRLPSNDVGSYAEFKYALVRLYCRLFSTGMKNMWPRTYIDLYSGPGHSRIRGSNKILLGSPLIALSVDDPFDKYIFCEEDQTCLSALESRVTRDFPSRTVSFIGADCNSSVDRIQKEILPGSLGLCFVDPFDLSIRFETIRKLATSSRLDFLCLLAGQMDAKRNLANYTGTNPKVDLFLGSDGWRDEWKQASAQGEDFAKFVALAFGRSMETLGYRATESHMMKEIRTDDRNVPLYYLALFSKHATAFKYWDEVKKYSTPQRGLFD